MDEKPRVIYKVRKSTGKTVAIIILIFLLLGSLSYIGYIKYQELNSSEVVEEKEARNELYYSEVDSIMHQIDMYNEVFKEIYPINDVDEINNQLKLQFGILALKKTENIHNYYKIEDMKEMYHNYFVSGFKAIYEDVECPAKDKNLYDLNNDTKTYVEVTNHEHGESSMNIDTYFVSGEIKENKYIINTNILYSNYCSGTCNPDGGYYESYEDCVNGQLPVTYKISEYEEIKEDLPVTTFTFVKDKNHFKLESVKIDN